MNTLSALFGALLLSGTAFGLPNAIVNGVEVERIYVDPAPHTIPKADFATLDRTPGAEVFYVPSGPFTPLELKNGTIYTFDNSTIEKRSGAQVFAAFGGYNCEANTGIAGVENFGCGQCIAWSGCGCGGALSAELSMRTTGNPKPTATLFKNAGCTGQGQSIGIHDGQIEGCTNSNMGDFYSAMVYYNCG